MLESKLRRIGRILGGVSGTFASNVPAQEWRIRRLGGKTSLEGPDLEMADIEMEGLLAELGEPAERLAADAGVEEPVVEIDSRPSASSLSREHLRSQSAWAAK